MHVRHVGLGNLICGGRVCPSQGVVFQLNRAEKTERGWEEGGVDRMMKMVDENMET